MTPALALALVAATGWAESAAVGQAPSSKGGRDAGGDAVVVERAATPSLMAPPRPRNLTRVAVDVRPFLGLIGNSWGGIGQARVEHYFDWPVMLGVELAPLAVAADGDGPGAIAHARLHAAFVSDYLAIGLGVGGKLQRFGPSGLSIAPTLRLGSLDGLNLAVEYSYSIAPNQYTGKRTIGFSNVLGTLSVPLARRLALQLDTGFSLDIWAYSSLGLRHRLTGDGGPGTWFVNAGLGAAWIVDRAPCNYDAVVPCGGSARSFGPSVSFGLERRF